MEMGAIMASIEDLVGPLAEYVEKELDNVGIEVFRHKIYLYANLNKTSCQLRIGALDIEEEQIKFLVNKSPLSNVCREHYSFDLFDPESFNNLFGKIKQVAEDFDGRYYRRDRVKLNQMHEPDMETMEKFFDKRTKRHIDLVQKYAQKIVNTNPDLADIVEQASKHDSSKYESPEHEPYVYLTWDYKCKNEGKDYKIPDNIDDNKASTHHVKHNRHHPEFHDEESGDDCINKDDRGAAPEQVVDGSKMKDIDVAEMVADWCAMSEELEEDTPKTWADNNVNKRWKFTDTQVELIYKLIADIWKTNEH